MNYSKSLKIIRNCLNYLKDNISKKNILENVIILNIFFSQYIRMNQSRHQNCENKHLNITPEISAAKVSGLKEFY